MSSSSISAPTSARLRVPCVRYTKYIATDASVQYKFNKKGSNKCSRYRQQKSSCSQVSFSLAPFYIRSNSVQIPSSLRGLAAQLLRFQRLLKNNLGSDERQASLLDAITTAFNDLKDRLEALTKSEAPLKSIEAVLKALLKKQKRTNKLLTELVRLSRI